LIEAGQAHAKRFQWSATARQVLSIYRDVSAGISH
jgi:hypothetical protein